MGWRRKPYRFCARPRCDQSQSKHTYIVGNIGQLRILQFACSDTLASPQVPFLYSHVLADRVQLVVVLKLECAHALSMAFQVSAFFVLSDVPYFEQAVIPTRKDSGLLRVELDHSDRGIVFSDYRCLVLAKALVDFCKFNLNLNTNTLRSLEQVNTPL